MRLTAAQYARTLMEVMETSDPKFQDTVLDNLVKVLVENNDLKLMDEIAEEFHKLELAKKGVKQAEVISARPLGREQEKRVLAVLNGMLKTDVELKKKIDENLIGGVVIRVEDKVIDASVKKNLQELKDSLAK